jgi:ATP-dependent DNA helicase RecQ
MNELLPLLKTHFGYDAFRPLQEEIIAEVLEGRDALVLMPTGGGKSLCFQLPSLVLPGLTIVISPLIALMKDQVDALKANGIAAESLHSGFSSEKLLEVQNQAQSGELSLLYLAPERLALPEFQVFLDKLKVSLIAVDEAHCISEWGHDFRPDYRNLKSLRQRFKDVPVIALTATATKRVQDDILNQLELKKAKVFLSSFNRPNLFYEVRPKKDAFQSLKKVLEEYQGKACIVYCLSRKSTEEIAQKLNQQGIQALPYHAGLTPEQRQANQESFIRDEISVMVATIAFGMGIDKPDVRLVVHFDLPKSLEGYYQETGRAGRDGLPSLCLLFYSFGDTAKFEGFIHDISNIQEREQARIKLAQIQDYCRLNGCRRAYLLQYFGETLNEECKACDNCLHPKEFFDASQISKKILSAIYRTHQRFGATVIAKLLLGKAEPIWLQKLSVYGIVQDFTEDELIQLIRSLGESKLLDLEISPYPVFKLSRSGEQFLKDTTAQINLPVPQKIIKSPKIDKIKVKKDKLTRKNPFKNNLTNYDEALFQRLRILRKQISDQLGVPPFIVFGDLSLIEMATNKPKNLAQFLEITGVGVMKQEKFGKLFLEAINC